MGLFLALTTMAGMILRESENEKNMVEGTEWFDHDGMKATNRYVSIRLTDMVHYHRVILG
jgi:hypothetical protein